jgi:hypothetical protein
MANVFDQHAAVVFERRSAVFERVQADGLWLRVSDDW